MDISGIFKDLWRGNREYSLTPRQHDALPTTQPLTAPASTPSTRKEKTSMVQILRQRYRHHRGSKGHSSDDTTEVSISSSCAPSQLKLRFDGDQQENSSLADFFKNYDMPDVTPMSSTSGSSNSSSPKFRIASPNTSIQTLATSIGSLRSFQLGLTAAGLPIFRRAALSVGKIIPADVQTGPASQNCPTCGAQPESKNNIKPIPVCTSVEHDSRDVIEVIEIDDKPVPEAHPISSAIEVETSATCIPCTNGSTLTPCTDVTGVSEDGTALERHQWDMIERITDESLMQLLQKAINQKPTNDVSIDDCSIDLRFRGGYNCVVMMSAVVNRRIKQYVARIPAIGTQSRGRDGDAHNMRCEVSLMKYMHVGRVLPIPKIVAFSDTLDTAIGAPFILMKLLRGRPAQMIWYEEPGNRNYETTAKVTPKTEVKRRNFLCSLAFQMSKLEYLRFDKIGTPDFTETLVTGTKPKVTYAYRWKSPHETKPEDLDSDDQIYEYGPFESSEEYMTAGIDEAWPNTHSADFDDYPDTENMIFGVRKILDILFAHPLIATSTIAPLDTDEPESFVLSHPDRLSEHPHRRRG